MILNIKLYIQYNLDILSYSMPPEFCKCWTVQLPGQMHLLCVWQSSF